MEIMFAKTEASEMYLGVNFSAKLDVNVEVYLRWKWVISLNDINCLVPWHYICNIYFTFDK